MSDSYVSMGAEENGASDRTERLLSADRSGSSTGLSSWLAVHRRLLLIGTAVTIGVVLLVAGVGLYLSSRSKHDEPPVSPVFSSSSSSSSSGSSAGVVHPACNGLYEWACADWFNRTALPVNRTSYSRFSEIDVLNTAALDVLLRDGHTGYPLLDTLYASCMDTERIDRLGLQPLQPHLDRLDAAPDWPAFMRLMGEWRATFGLSVIVAPSLSVNQSRSYLSLSQAPLLLFNRTQYGNASAVQALQGAIQRMLTAAGDSAENATAHAQAVVSLEQQLNAAMPRTTEPRQQMGSADELLRYSNVHFDSWLDGAQIPLLQLAPSDFRVGFPTAAFFQFLNDSAMMAPGEQPSRAWKQYARYKLLSASAPYLSQNLFSAFTNTHFPLRETDPLADGAVDMTGRSTFQAQVKVASEPQLLSADDARHVVCRRLANLPDVGSELLGHAFMDRHFNATAHGVVESMIDDIRQAWTQWLPNIDWLDAEGRQAFQRKMDNMQTFIGGPPLLASYANVSSHADDFFSNVLSLRRAHALDLWNSISQPYDLVRLWNGSPASTVNAFYYAQQNAFYLYAGFFQPPLFFLHDYTANAPWTGEVIGHEAGHGFDRNGIHFNERGVRTPWLSPAVSSAFDARTACTMNSYSQLQWNGSYVDGNKTIGEVHAEPHSHASCFIT